MGSKSRGDAARKRQRTTSAERGRESRSERASTSSCCTWCSKERSFPARSRDRCPLYRCRGDQSPQGGARCSIGTGHLHKSTVVVLGDRDLLSAAPCMRPELAPRIVQRRLAVLKVGTVRCSLSVGTARLRNEGERPTRFDGSTKGRRGHNWSVRCKI